MVGELFLSGCSVRMIASELDVPKSSVHRFLKHLSISENR
ncbi:MAG: helix-turn-helix domain-containing protein [Candidatus Aenigmarchaeota archaeon]|nr:helix-turn-helix domain-containing protein [Candidatus Aenigmarchaeota archaeon]